MRHKLWWGGSALAVVVVVVIGIVLVTRREDTKPAGQGAETGARPVAGAQLGGQDPGALVSASTMPEFNKRAQGAAINAARVIYHSTEGDTGAPTQVSASVFVPPGDAPAGGWPVIALGHGTVGIDEPCAPSLSASLLSMAEVVDKFIASGYAVTLADFQGLGAPGVHPYLDSMTAGRNIIDSVRALRKTFPNVSDRWAAWGGSQGGGAVWAASELAGSYAPDLNLIATVALAPAADVAGLVDKAVEGTLSKEQSAALTLVIESIARLDPAINRDDYRRGIVAEKWDVLIACAGDAVRDRADVIDKIQPGDVAPHDAAAADRLRAHLRAWALPQQRSSGPLSVTYGGEDEYIDPAWTAHAIEAACAMGTQLISQFQPEHGHGDLDVGEQFGWLLERMHGTPAEGGCA
jgi:hypothetical protein